MNNKLNCVNTVFICSSGFRIVLLWRFRYRMSHLAHICVTDSQLQFADDIHWFLWRWGRGWLLSAFYSYCFVVITHWLTWYMSSCLRQRYRQQTPFNASHNHFKADINNSNMIESATEKNRDGQQIKFLRSKKTAAVDQAGASIVHHSARWR